MKWFRRKPKKFDYAAIRIGNVYVLPPGGDVAVANGSRKTVTTVAAHL